MRVKIYFSATKAMANMKISSRAMKVEGFDSQQCPDKSFIKSIICNGKPFVDGTDITLNIKSQRMVWRSHQKNPDSIALFDALFKAATNDPDGKLMVICSDVQYTEKAEK